MKPNPQSFDDFAVQYDRATSIERQHDFFLAHLPSVRNSVLDVGCGTGLLAYELSHHFRSLVALDISGPMLAIARTKRNAPNIDYRLCDANDLPSGEFFDAIVSHTTFHHLADIPATVTKLKASLAPGGRLIFVDCITRFSHMIPRWNILYWGHAALEFVPDLLRHGITSACLLFRFRVCRPWIAHLKTDRYFTPAEFREAYSQLLPGAKITKTGSFMNVIWTATDNEVTEPTQKQSYQSV